MRHYLKNIRVYYVDFKNKENNHILIFEKNKIFLIFFNNGSNHRILSPYKKFNLNIIEISKSKAYRNIFKEKLGVAVEFEP